MHGCNDAAQCSEVARSVGAYWIRMALPREKKESHIDPLGGDELSLTSIGHCMHNFNPLAHRCWSNFNQIYAKNSV